MRAGRPSRVKLLGSLLLAVAIFAFLLRRVDVDAVWAEIQEMTWFELVTIALIAGWNLVTYWALWMAVTPGLRWTQAMTVAQSGTAVTNTVPGGSGIGVGLALAMLDSWGFSRARSTLAVLITGVWNTFIKLALPVLALALIALQGDASATRVAAGATAIVLLGVAVGGFWQMLRSDRAAARAGVLAERTANRARRLLKRPPVHGWAEATTRFRNRTRDLLRSRGGWITAAALVSHLSLYLVLLVTLRHVGVGDAEVGWAQVLFVFAGARLATAIRFTPGGAGVVEAVLIGGLVAFGGDPAQVTASVLVFRALTWLLPVPLGGLTYLGWRWQHRLATVPIAMNAPPPGPRPRSGWPLVLAGPMPRRVEPGAVSVFVACRHPRAVELSIHRGTEPGPDTLVHTGQGRTVPLGRFLHVAVVTARPPVALAPGAVYGYDLRFHREGDHAGDDGQATDDLGSLGLADQLGYRPGHLPSFVLPPERLEQVRFVHGSCRKPHGQRRDALATLDQILEATHADAEARPQQLFLTGDQIYADDVAPGLLALCGQVGRAALGWERAEPLPDAPDAGDFRLAPGRRDHLVRHRAGFTGPVLDCHLMSLAEFYGMYLLIWSDALWPRDPAGAATLPAAEEVLDHPAWRDDAHRRSHRTALARTAGTRTDVLEFARTLPRVRRALANIATDMIFDDHDVTDDWNLHRRWHDHVHRRPLGRRMVQNALAAYAVFQGWGNEPDQFAAGQPGGRLLEALAAWDGQEGPTGETLRARLGLPSADASAPIRWDYQLDTPSFQAIVLDTRTQRGFRRGGNGLAAPALLGRDPMARQLTRRLAARPREVPVTVLVSAAPVFGHPLIEAKIQLKRIKAIEWSEQGPAAVDREAWSLDPAAFEALLATLVPFGQVVILSGDVHYGFAGSVAYWDRRDGVRRQARFVQCTSTPLKNEDRRTRLLGGVPTVVKVPGVPRGRVERLLARLTTPPSLSFVGWPHDPHPRGRRRWWLGRRRSRRTPYVLPAPLAAAHRLAAEPQWGYQIDFQADAGVEPLVPGRSGAFHHRALRLRAENRWSFMHTIVGRNNLGDVEFLPGVGGRPGMAPDLVRQSLWFDKTSIRSGDEPERLPYTVYDLPLAPPEDGDAAGVR